VGNDIIFDAEPVLPTPQILILLGAYTPGYKAGGPIRSVENLVAALGAEFQFKIVTMDRDLGDKVPFPGVPANQWVRVGEADVMYLRPGLRGLQRLWKLLRSVDRRTVLYLNSFFARRFSMLAIPMRRLRLCRPVCLVLAPRGEFSPGALQLKPLRKRLYIRISRWLGVYEGALWHASSTFEAEDILRQFPGTKYIDIAGVLPASSGLNPIPRSGLIAMASDIAGSELPDPTRHSGKVLGKLRVVFVGRCSRMKNLSGAIRLLMPISGDVSFDIFGPLEDAQYWRECQCLIAALPPNIRVRHEGEIAHARVAQIFAEHDLFLFPTLGENFGHVICESLAAGCPVLTSDRTPWRNLEAKGIGWDIPLSEPERFQSILQQCVDGSAEWFAAMTTRATNYAAERASDSKTIDANRRLFRSAFARSPQRDVGFNQG
jgi:glycosyltransferase involved in cell wall biosynthesis